MNRKKQIVFSLAIVFLALVTGARPGETCATQPDSSTIKVSGKTMGPIDFHVVVANPPGDVSQTRVQTAVQQTLDRIDTLMSTYRPDSDISRFNRRQSTDWQPVEIETAQVVQRSLEISQQTDGAFDVTIAPAVNLWQFGPDKKDAFELPTEKEIAQLKRRVGYEKLNVRLDPPALKKTNPNVSIDLSAIAKGYAVDQVGRTLVELGCNDYMVEVGGEVTTFGQRAGGGNWRIGVETPQELVRQIGRIAELSGQAMATSGDYRNFGVIRGKRYSHTIDPETCRPVEHSLASACVVAPDCMTADAMATAVMVLGTDRGMKLCELAGLHLLTVTRNQDFGDQFTETATENFPFSGGPEVAVKKNPTVSNRNQHNSASIWPAFIGAMVVISLAILGMAVGAIFGNNPVRGSCGGLANMTNADGESNCSICAKPTTDCVESR